jgi:hypothetical protein
LRQHTSFRIGIPANRQHSGAPFLHSNAPITASIRNSKHCFDQALSAFGCVLASFLLSDRED